MRLVHLLGASVLVLAPLAACRSKDAPAESAQPPQLVTVGRENIAVAAVTDLRSGPPISGSLEPEQSATVRAEVGGTVLKTYAEAGDQVKRGAVLARIEDVALRDAALSARSGLRSAQASLELARRNLERTERLSQAGAVADRDLESARLTATNAEGALADAQARLASAEQQLGHATVRAPFSGVVSERQADEGDVVQLGAALFSVVDPASLRLEANVSADQAGRLRPGTPVEFSVTGFARPFSGKIARVNPVVDPSTRQVRIYATIPNRDRALVAGLFAQGRVATQSSRGVAVPVAAVDERSSAPVVHRLEGGKVIETPVKLGIRDEVAELVEVASGVTAGDTLLLGSAQGISPGSRVRVLQEETDR
jgi:membrane fusion protein (multidrug efflux system)